MLTFGPINIYVPGFPDKIHLLGVNSTIEPELNALIKSYKPEFQKRISFTTHKELDKVIALSELPVNVGGQRKKLNRLPKNIQSGKCLKHLDKIPTKDWKTFTNTSIDCITEGMKEANAVKRLKDSLSKHYEKDKDLKSIEKRNADFLLERYLVATNKFMTFYCSQHSEAEALKWLIKAIDYGKNMQVMTHTELDYPSEFFATGAVHYVGKSRTGQPVVSICFRCIRPFTRMSAAMLDLAHNYILQRCKTALFDAKEKNFHVVIDFTGTKGENIDFSDFIPGTPDKIHIIGLNPLLEEIAKLLKEFKPDFRNRLLFTNHKKLNKVIALSELPACVGGKVGRKKVGRLPKGFKSGKCHQHLNKITNDDWQKLLDTNIDCIGEGMLEANVKTVDDYLNTKCK
ncbi:unnamed protein product [Medioppia subpectinata]|uniref:CRAL-TRIO domain-containing protein n=1 Tax=Medioppia subpectinata TaxID=1979941 RepID=A0A7R9PUT1_9ACAR|nr:unnamed protein product [Medioppia subpectinata]CAG2101107.1 unnamed protein product [Medioppia subpectinata]